MGTNRPHRSEVSFSGLDRKNAIGARRWPVLTDGCPRLARRVRYSTVTDFARFRGWSTSWPSSTATL
jgi:hypothetical protein